MTKELLHEHKVLSVPQLLHLDLETTSYCNFNCYMCPRPEVNGSMHIENIKLVIKQFAEAGGQTIKPFWRGEPTADIRMPEILKYAQECGLKTMLNTNGSFPHRNEAKIAMYLDWISFSIDQQHGNYHNETTWFRASGMQANGVHTEIQSCEHYKDLEEFCKISGIVYKVDKPTKRLDGDNISEVLTGERKYCGEPDWRIVVRYDGFIYPCCLAWNDKTLEMGHVSYAPLVDTFKNNHFTMLRQNLQDGNVYKYNTCKDCPSRKAYK